MADRSKSPSRLTVSMSPEFLKSLRCPVCRSPLNLEGGDTLLCARCDQSFPIENGIPNLFIRWEPDMSRSHPFESLLFSPAAITRRVSEEKISEEEAEGPVDPLKMVPLKFRKFFVAGRLVLWACLFAAIFFKSTRFLLMTIAACGFLIDFIFLAWSLRRQNRKELALLSKFSEMGQLHEKDRKDPIPDADEMDVHAVAENLKEDITEALKGIELKNKKVLHVGCGGGESTQDVPRAYHEKFASNVGLDIYAPSLISFVTLFSAEGVLADALSLPFPDNYFDMTNCTDIIEHVYDPYRLIEENLRVLKPGGWMLMTTPNRSRLRASVTALNPIVFIQSVLGGRFPALLSHRDLLLLHRNNTYFHTSFTSSELKSLLTKAGFEIEWMKIKAYRGPFKGFRRILESLPFANQLNDCLFALVKKPHDLGD